jgi:DNA polymerase-1
MDYIGQRKLSIGALIGEKNKVQGTMDMAPIEDVCRYACTDADLTWKLEQVLAPKLVAAGLDTLMTTVEIPLMHVLADMEWQGVKVDLNKMRALSDELGKRLQELEKEAYTTYDVLNINSPTQVGKYLYDKLGMPPDPDFGYTTKADVLADLNLSTPHPFLDLMLEHRGLKKLKSTYLDGMPRMVSKRTGRIHTSFNQMITATGRLSSSEPNLQNIPMRSERGRMIRAMFIPTTYDTIMTADYSQIELRLLADQSDDTALIRAFESGEDIHAFVAAEVYGVKLADVTKEMRMKAKTVNFGIVYGMSYKALAKRIGVTPREAQSFIQDYFKRYRRVKQWMEEIISAARKNGYVLTILGRRRDVSAEIRASDRGTAGSGERKAVNTVIQGSAADLIKVAMNKVHSSLIIKQARLLLQVHDELVIELPSSEIKDVRSIVEYDMVNAMKLKVPVTVNIETGPNWLEAK